MRSCEGFVDDSGAFFGNMIGVRASAAQQGRGYVCHVVLGSGFRGCITGLPTKGRPAVLILKVNGCKRNLLGGIKASAAFEDVFAAS